MNDVKQRSRSKRSPRTEYLDYQKFMTEVDQFDRNVDTINRLKALKFNNKICRNEDEDNEDSAVDQ